MFQAVGDVMYPVMFETGKPDQDKVDKLKEVLGWVDGFVAEDKFCAGTSHITIADIAFLITFSTFKVGKICDANKTYICISGWGRQRSGPLDLY